MRPFQDMALGQCFTIRAIFLILNDIKKRQCTAGEKETHFRFLKAIFFFFFKALLTLMLVPPFQDMALR